MPREQSKNTNYFPTQSPSHKWYEIPRNKAEFHVFSNPHWTSLLWSCSMFLWIQKNFHHLPPSSVSSHLQRAPVCGAYGLWSTDFKRKIKKPCPQYIGHTHVSTNSVLQFLSKCPIETSGLVVRSVPDLDFSESTGIIFAIYQSINPQAQRWLKAGGDKLQLTTITTLQFTEVLLLTVILVLFIHTILFST